MVNIQALPAYSDNYIWLITDTDESSAYVVDPGEAKVVKAFIEENELTLEAILLTHQHWDHVTGIPELCERYNCPVYGPKIEQHPTVTHPVSEGDSIKLWGKWPCSVLETPGHLPDHISWKLETTGKLHMFCADTLFSAGCGRIFRGTHEELLTSLKRLASFPDDTLLYPAHEYTLANLRFARHVEPENQILIEEYQALEVLRSKNLPTLPTTVLREKRINPYLRCSEKTLVSAVSQHTGHELNSELEVFTELRRWKDVH